MTTIKPGLEAISIRRTSIEGAGKVRYRVYTSPNEFTTVEAESALMAVRASGVKTPHKIVREMPGEGGKVEAQRLVKEETAPAVTNPHNARPAREEMKQLLTELAEKPSEESILFVPMDLADMRSKGMTRARILPAEMLQEIIEEHARQHPPEVAAPPPPPEEPMTPEPAVLHRPPPEPSQAEKVAALADQVLQPAGDTPVTPAVEPELSPEEVQKLLNE